MYFSDTTCATERSLAKTQALNVFELLEADWTGILIVTRHGRVILEKGAINFSNIDENTIVNYIEKNFQSFHPKSLNEVSDQNGNYLIWQIRFDETKSFKVYSVVYRLDPFAKESLNWYHIVLKMSYDQVLLENNFTQEKNYYSNIFHSNLLGICNFDMNGSVVNCNELIREMFIGVDGIEDVWNVKGIPYIKDNWSDIIDQVAIRRERLYVEKYKYSQNEYTCFYTLIFAPIINSKNDVMGTTLVAANITTNVLLEEENQQVKHFALLGEIATGVAHDVRNPLMNIKSIANFLKRTMMSDEETQSLEHIITEADRINLVVDELLSYVDVSGQTSDILIDINDVISKSVSIVKRNKGNKDVSFEEDLQDDIPPITGGLTSLHQSFVNLLLNAVQAIDNDGIVSISTRFDNKNNTIQIQVYDNGDIMPKEVQQNIFKPFYSTKSDGIGFGLSVVKRVISKHGGEISFTSTKKEGTIFTICLPINL